MTIAHLTIGILATMVMNCQNKNQSLDTESQISKEEMTLKENELILWINSYKVNCNGVGEQLCLQIQKGSKITDGQWEYFYGYIEGLDWETGYIYHVKVTETHIPVDQVPADGSSLHYSLVKELSKESDTTIRLHDIWALVSIDGKEWESKILERPSLEINLTQGKVMGTDGCNRYHGDILSVSPDIMSLGPIASTKMACPEMEISNLFHQKMARVESYNLNGLELTLLDASGNTLMKFKKVD